MDQVRNFMSQFYFILFLIGKTTLLKLLVEELEPVRGQRHGHRNLAIGYFTQHFVDQLPMNVNCVEVLQLRCPGKLNFEHTESTDVDSIKIEKMFFR